jgi:hypothetical protein
MMSNDPTGTVGAPRGATATPESNLSLAIAGGARFMERLQKMGEETDRLNDAAERHGKALAELKLGEAAVDAHKRAEALKAEAQSIRNKAQSDYDAKMAEVAKIKKDADAYDATTRNNANAYLSSAKDELAAADRKQIELDALIEQTKAAKDAAARATKAANDRHAELKSKLDQLHKIVADVSA